MKSESRIPRIVRLGVFALVFSWVVGSAAAHAQSTTLDAFRPAPSPRDGFALGSTETDGRLRLDAQLYLEYANDPLVYERTSGTTSNGFLRIVEHQLVVHGLVSLTLHDRLLVYLGVPVDAVMSGSDPGALPIYSADGAGIGDVHVGARVSLFGDARDGFSLAAQGAFYVPTSQIPGGVHYAGDETVRGHVQVLGQYRLEAVRIVAALGGMFRGPQDIGGGITIGQQLTFGLGATVPLVNEQVAFVAELDGATTFDDFFDREQTTLELLAGGRYFHESGLIAGVGAGPGLARGYGSPDVRVLATVAYSRELAEEEEEAAVEDLDTDADGLNDSVDVCDREPEDVDQFQDADGCPDLDNDEDGLADTGDQCPLDPEDRDGFEDENGCPDPDDDGDGVLDAADSCPREPEDADQFEDENGCPDPDNDADGLADAEDECPVDAGPVANHGCPDGDRDGDTVVDRLDNCPDEPGPATNQGCAMRQQVRIEEGRLVITDAVYFATNRAVIQRRSFRLLDNVARVLAAHPEIIRVRIEGHTDARGDHDKNLALSQARADSVMQYLIGKGIDASRLTAQGFGPDRPVVPDARTRADHARNRRVEFNIEGTESISVPSVRRRSRS